jgi:alkylation response protein AidB-like acyl-CoA dehydrogenase
MDPAVLPHFDLPPETVPLRHAVRAFLAECRDHGDFEPAPDAWYRGHDPAFSAALGRQGWIGMTWPSRYGGGDRSALERFVVVEELLAAGAPVAAHWPSDRQVGPMLLRYGTEEQRRRFLPGIARGETYFAVGMSEPDSGSDLTSVRTRAERRGGHWVVNGAKIWTTAAHQAHHIVVLLRTSPPGEDRHAGLSQLIVDLSAPGVEIRPILNLDGSHEFNEVVFSDVAVADDRVIGEIGQGWEQVTGELSLERGGPERFLSSWLVLREAVRVAQDAADEHAAAVLGDLVAQLWALREMSVAVAGALDSGGTPAVASALVKDLGTCFDQTVVDAVRRGLAAAPDPGGDPLGRLLAATELVAPVFTLRGGTTEILRGVIARGLGL